MKNKLLLTLFLFSNINSFSQTITTYSTGYTSLEGIAVNSNNTVFVSQNSNGKVFQIDNTNGTSTEYASTGGFYANNISFNANNDLFIAEPFTDDIYRKNSASAASIYLNLNIEPNSICFDTSGNLYFSSMDKIVKVTPSLTQTDYATGFLYAEGLDFDNDGNLYVADRSDRKLYKIQPNGTSNVVASYIDNIRGVVVAPNGKVYFTTYNPYSSPVSNKIKSYDPVTNTVSDYITTGLNEPRHLVIDDLGNIFVTNRGNGSVVKIHDDTLLSFYTNEIFQNDFSIYPNPVNDILYIDMSIQPSNIYIYNNIGQIVLENSNSNQIDLTILNSGIYFVKVKSQSEVFGNKLIIKK